MLTLTSTSTILNMKNNNFLLEKSQQIKFNCKQIEIILRNVRNMAKPSEKNKSSTNKRRDYNIFRTKKYSKNQMIAFLRFLKALNTNATSNLSQFPRLSRYPNLNVQTKRSLPIFVQNLRPQKFLKQKPKHKAAKTSLKGTKKESIYFKATLKSTLLLVTRTIAPLWVKVKVLNMTNLFAFDYLSVNSIMID